MQTRNKEVTIKLEHAKSIIIVTHVSPDGDAIGSSLGLYHYLKSFKENVKVIVPNAFPDFLNWLPESNSILIYENNKEVADELMQHADIIFCLDFNETNRTAFMKASIDSSPAYKILIDHHIGAPNWQDANFCVVGASSTCELVFDFIKNHSDTNFLLSEKIAYPLYTGLLTDTGNFQYSATSAKVHLIAAQLMEAGVQPDLVHNHINNSFDIQRLKFFGYCISEKMTIIPEKKLAYTIVSKEEIKKYNIQTGGTEGLVNEPMKINDIMVSVLIKEDDDKVKMSFRSKEKIDVSSFARTYFNGGGHLNAAGGVSFKSLRETEKDFLKFIQDFNID